MGPEAAARYRNGDCGVLVRLSAWLLAPQRLDPSSGFDGVVAAAEAAVASQQRAAGRGRRFCSRSTHSRRDADTGHRPAASCAPSSLCQRLRTLAARAARAALLLLSVVPALLVSHAFVCLVVILALGLGLHVGRALFAATGVPAAFAHDTYALAAGMFLLFFFGDVGIVAGYASLNVLAGLAASVAAPVFALATQLTDAWRQQRAALAAAAALQPVSAPVGAVGADAAPSLGGASSLAVSVPLRLPAALVARLARLPAAPSGVGDGAVAAARDTAAAATAASRIGIRPVSVVDLVLGTVPGAACGGDAATGTGVAGRKMSVCGRAAARARAAVRRLCLRSLLWALLPLWRRAMISALDLGGTYRVPRMMTGRRAASLVLLLGAIVAVGPLLAGSFLSLVIDPLGSVAAVSSVALATAARGVGAVGSGAGAIADACGRNLAASYRQRLSGTAPAPSTTGASVAAELVGGLHHWLGAAHATAWRAAGDAAVAVGCAARRPATLALARTAHVLLGKAAGLRAASATLAPWLWADEFLEALAAGPTEQAVPLPAASASASSSAALAARPDPGISLAAVLAAANAHAWAAASASGVPAFTARGAAAAAGGRGGSDVVFSTLPCSVNFMTSALPAPVADAIERPAAASASAQTNATAALGTATELAQFPWTADYSLLAASAALPLAQVVHAYSHTNKPFSAYPQAASAASAPDAAASQAAAPAAYHTLPFALVLPPGHGCTLMFRPTGGHSPVHATSRRAEPSQASDGAQSSVGSAAAAVASAAGGPLPLAVVRTTPAHSLASVWVCGVLLVFLMRLLALFDLFGYRARLFSDMLEWRVVGVYTTRLWARVARPGLKLAATCLALTFAATALAALGGEVWIRAIVQRSLTGGSAAVTVGSAGPLGGATPAAFDASGMASPAFGAYPMHLAARSDSAAFAAAPSGTGAAETTPRRWFASPAYPLRSGATIAAEPGLPLHRPAVSDHGTVSGDNSGFVAAAAAALMHPAAIPRIRLGLRILTSCASLAALLCTLLLLINRGRLVNAQMAEQYGRWQRELYRQRYQAGRRLVDYPEARRQADRRRRMLAAGFTPPAAAVVVGAGAGAGAPGGGAAVGVNAA
jgi:hypothetical protein